MRVEINVSRDFRVRVERNIDKKMAAIKEINNRIEIGSPLPTSHALVTHIQRRNKIVFGKEIIIWGEMRRFVCSMLIQVDMLILDRICVPTYYQ